jgi:hypothetical protein
MTTPDELKVYHRMISKYKKIIYVWFDANDDVVEFFTLEQYQKNQINDVSKRAFELISQEHGLIDMGVVNLEQILEKL